MARARAAQRLVIGNLDGIEAIIRYQTESSGYHLAARLKRMQAELSGAGCKSRDLLIEGECLLAALDR